MPNHPLPQNRLSDLDKLYLRTAAQWSQILGYLIVLFATLVIIDVKRRALLIRRNPTEFDEDPISNPSLMVCFAIAVFAAGFMYILGKKIENAILLHDAEQLADGFNYLKLFVKIATIGVIVASFVVIPLELLIIAHGGF